MKLNHFKTILYTLILLLVASSFSVTYASGINVYVTPVSSTKNVNDSINADIKVNAGGNDVCVVKGTIVLENMSCKSITLSEGLMAQAVPTCSKPSFTVGIPSCTKAEKTLFTVNADFPTAGSSTVKLSGVSVIGIGVMASSTSADANYTVLAKVTPITPVVVDQEPEVIDDIGTTSDVEKEVPATTSAIKVVETPVKKTSMMASLNNFLSNVSGEVVAWIVIIMVASIIIITGWKADHKEKKVEDKDKNKDNK